MKTNFHKMAACAILLLWLPAVLASAPSRVLAQNEVYVEDFEDGQAQGWRLDPSWQVIQVDDNYVLSGEGHTWSEGDRAYDDYRLSFRLKLIKGTVHLNYRMSETGRYFITFDAGHSSLNKQYFPDTFQNGLAGKTAKHNLNQWIQVEIVGAGSSLTFIVDGQTEWTYSDPEPILVGRFAFETLEDSQVYVDDVRVELASTSAYGTVASLKWERTGGPLGGLGYDIRMRPDNPDIMYVTDAKAGVFKSTDGGKTWLSKVTGITARSGMTGDEIPIFSLTLDPQNSDTIWVGTQWQSGFFKSTDAGETWTKKDRGVTERGLTTRGFGVDPHNSDVVYAAGEISSWEWAGEQRIGREFDMTKGVVYKTTDGGENWKKVWEGDNLARYVWIDPRDTNVVYVSTGIFDREAANSDVRNGKDGGVGVIKSLDGGETWQQINNGLQNLYVGSLFMHPLNPDILLAGTGTAWASSGAGVYLTTDGGVTWKLTLPALPMIQSVEFSTTDPQVAYAGGYRGIYRSKDGGLTWTVMQQGECWGAPGICAGIPFDFQVDPRNPDRIFSNQYGGGNFLSLDGGKSWEAASKGYTGAAIRDIAVDAAQPGRVIVGARSGIFASYNGGADWIGLSFPPFYSGDWHVIAIDPSNTEHLIAGITGLRNLVNSADGGLSWQQTQQFPEGTQKGFDTVVFAPSNPTIVYAGAAGWISSGHFTSDVPSSGYNATTRMPGAGVFISHDGGTSWQQSPDPQLRELAVSKLEVDPRDPQVVYASTFHHGLYRSSDGGQSWSQVGGGLPADKSITVVRVSPHDSGIVYAGRNQGGLYRSTDGGTNWSQLSAGLPPEGVITDLVFDPTDRNVLYATEAFSGPYRSEDGGNTWMGINNGLLTRSINRLAISGDGLHVYAASEGSGVYRLDLNGQPPAPAPQPTPIPTSPPPTALAPDSTSTPKPTPLTGLPCINAVILPLMIGPAFALKRRAQHRTRIAP